MPASSNFNQAIREAQTSSIVGPNVVQKALPYVGGGMALTAFGALGGLTLSQSPIYGPLFLVAIIAINLSSDWTNPLKFIDVFKLETFTNSISAGS